MLHNTYWSRDAGLGRAGGHGALLTPQFLADQLTLFEPGGADYSNHITTAPPPGFWTVQRLCVLNGFGLDQKWHFTQKGRATVH